MTRAHLTALVATLAMGAVAAPRLAAQDTSATAGQARQDTSGYTGAGGVDTSRVDSSGARGAATTDSTGRAAKTHTKTHTRKRSSSRLRDAPGRVDAKDTTGALGATDTSGMKGRHPDTTHVGDTASARPAPQGADTGAAGARSYGDSGSTGGGGGGTSVDTARLTEPPTQPGQTTSPSGSASDSTRSQ